MSTTNRKLAFVAWCALVVAVLSCTATTNALPTYTATAASTRTAVTTATRTSTPAVTPTLGYRSAWRTGQIAFASNRTGRFQIYLMKPDGSGLKQLTDSPGDNRSPVWSGDGKTLFFASTRDGNSEIYKMNADGSDQEDLTNDPRQDSLPAWLPGNQLAFISNRAGRDRIFIMDLEGDKLTAFPQTSISASSHFMCLGAIEESMVAYTTENGSERLTRVLDTSKPDVFTPPDLNGDQQSSCISAPQLTSDSWMIFTSNRDGPDQVYKYNLDTDAQIQLTSGSEPSLGVSRSSDESWIAFSSSRAGNWDIFLMAMQGKDQWNITNDPADDVEPAWQPY